MAFVTPVVEHWLEREISQWVNRSDDPSHHDRMPLPRSYILLLFYLMTHATDLVKLYGVGHMVKDHSDSTRGNPHGYSFRLTARVLLYAPSHRQEDSIYHSLCYTSRGALAGMRTR